MIMRKRFSSAAVLALAMALLITLLCGCSRRGSEPQPEEPVQNSEPSGPNGPAGAPEAETAAERQDGERFEAVVVMEGMEETVRYEHIRNDAVGFGMDYDYERFQRRSQADRESFVSCWDDPENPENCLNVRYDPRDAETVAAGISAVLSARRRRQLHPDRRVCGKRRPDDAGASADGVYHTGGRRLPGRRSPLRH